MTITCVLFGQDSRIVTETAVETEAFLAASDNPFPASHLESALLCGDIRTVIYRVNPATEEESE